MRDGDDLVAEPEGEEQLGGVRHEADDPHEETSMASSDERERARPRPQFEGSEAAAAFLRVV